MKRDDDLHTWRGLTGGIVVGLLLWILICWAAYGVWQYFHPCERAGVAEPWVKERHKYHGISVSFEDWEGNHFFVRDGKKVRL